MGTTAALKKSLLSCPGDTIQEHIDFIGMSQAELAERLGRSVPKLNELIKGKAPITKETAQKLEYVLGVDAGFWLNLEKQYQEELLEIEQLEFLAKCNDWIKGFPLAELKKKRILPYTRKTNELVEALLRFFKVGSPKEWSAIYEESSLAFKIELKYTSNPKAISTWLQIGELQAESLKIASFDKKELTKKLPEIQKLSYEQPENWLAQLQSICASFGVALAYTPSIPKAPIYGATRWIKKKSIPLIQITDRNKDYNSFWFTFYHELGHIRYHNKSDIFLSGLDEINPDEEKEKEADEFAIKMLFPESVREEVFAYPNFDAEIILNLSEKLQVHPSIIVGQIQRTFNHLYKSIELNSLKTRVEFEELLFDL